MSNVKHKKERCAFGKRLIAVLLVTVMLLAMAPAVSLPVFAASDSTTPYRIVMLDCGRKYFSVDNIKKLIDTMAQYGYNQLTLAFGNGGCRFLLNDMSLSFDGTTMSSDTVKANITEGNNNFNGDTRYLGESGMDTIIAYANNKGIEIVPLLNMPGHATAILYNTSYTSNGNLNVNDEASRNYGYALLKKYVDYFKGKGCKYFHFGADESGFSGDGMSAFLQGCSDVITSAGMTPRMFNDPADGTNAIPSGVEITYWYQNNHKSASYLNRQGYSLINTHGRWYYVIKSAQNSEEGTKYWQGTVNSTATSVELPVMKAEKMDGKWVGINEFFDGNPGYGSTITNSLGTMFCIWCDASQDAYLTDSDVISENENYGALYQLEKMAEHYWPDDIKSSTEEEVPETTFTLNSTTYSAGQTATVNAVSGNNVTLTLNNIENKNVTVTSDNDTVASAEYNSGTVTVSAKSAGTAKITVAASAIASASIATYADTAETFTLVVNVLDETANNEITKNITIEVGDKETFDVADDVNAGSYISGNEAYIATATVAKTEKVAETTVSTTKSTTIESGASYIMRVYNTNYALTSNTGRTAWGTPTLAFEAYTKAEADNVWQLEASRNGYKIKSAAGYLNLGTGNNTAYVNTTGEVFTLTYTTTGWTVKNPSGKYINALGGLTYYYSAGGWTGDDTRFDLYKVTEKTEASSTLTITGIGEGTTSVTVGNTNYKITVTAPSTKETKALTFGGSFTPVGTDVTITSGNDVVTLADGKIVAGNTAGTATVTSIVKNKGGYVTEYYTYTVKVASIDFSGIADLNVQLWITNTWVGENGAPTSLQTKNLKAEDAYSEDGVLLKNYVPNEGYKKDGSNTVKVTFWKGAVLGTAPVQQGADLSGSGDDFTLVRYWNNAWQYYGENGWTDVGSNYVIAYYLQINNVSPEITTGTKDYGNPPTSDPGSNSTNGFTLTAFAVVYPDGTLSRTEQEMYETGMLRGFWGSTEFGIGLVFAENNSTYKVSKMTVTWGTNIKNNLYSAGWYTGSQSGTYGTDWGVKWNKVTNSAGVEWYDETTYWQAGDSEIPMIDGDKYDLKFNTTDHHAVLILIYLETVETDDSLKVIYWDDASNIQIPANDIFIDVKKGENFYTGLKQTSTVPQEDDQSFVLDNVAYIINSDGVQQAFNTEISTVPGVSGTYLSGMYIFDHASFDNEGKTMVLHYRLAQADQEKTYVVDFGLSVEIPISDFFQEGDPNIDSISLEKAKETLDMNGHYGRAVISSDYTKVTYKLFNILPSGKVTIPLYIKLTGNDDAVLYQAHIYPASTVYYEEEFITVDDDWSLVGDNDNLIQTPTRDIQTNSELGDQANYGYDSAYESDTKHSGGSAYKVTVNAETNSIATASFTFTGNRFDLISSVSQQTGTIFVFAKNAATNAQKFWIVDSFYGIELVSADAEPYVKYTWTKGTDDKWHVDNDKTEKVAEVPTGKVVGQFYDNTDGTRYSYASNRTYKLNATNEVLYQVPIISKTLDYGTWTVTVKVVYDLSFDHANRGSYDFYIDGVRIYNTLNDSSVYGADGENNPQFTEIRDMLIDVESINEESKANYAAVFVDGIDSTTSVQDLKNYGPNDEVYLANGQAIAFKVDVDSGKTYYIGAKSPNGGASMVVNDGESQEIKTATDMYYQVTPTDDGYIVVANNGEGILSLTTIKAVGGSTEDASTAVASYSVDSDVVAYACAMVLDMVQPASVFEPETLEASWTTIKFFSFASHTLSVSTSADVEYITVGERELHDFIYTYKFEGSGWNRKLVKYKLFTLTLGSEAELGDYSVVAYNAEGSASAPITATLTGKVGVGKFN